MARGFATRACATRSAKTEPIFIWVYERTVGLELMVAPDADLICWCDGRARGPPSRNKEGPGYAGDETHRVRRKISHQQRQLPTSAANVLVIGGFQPTHEKEPFRRSLMKSRRSSTSINTCWPAQSRVATWEVALQNRGCFDRCLLSPRTFEVLVEQLSINKD